MQKRVLVLARMNADKYNPDRWWEDAPTQGYRSLLYRFQVAAPGAAPAGGAVRLPDPPPLRADALYATACPSFREQVRRLALGDGLTQVAFTCADTPVRETEPTDARGTVTLYPGSPLLAEDVSGFDLLSQLGRDTGVVITFEAGGGYDTLLDLFGLYMKQYGAPGGMVRLPPALTDPTQMSGDLSALVLDAVFAPGAVYRFTNEAQDTLARLTKELRLQGKYAAPHGGQPTFLAAAVLDFRRIVVTVGASALKVLDDQLGSYATGVAATADVVPDLAKFLRTFQDARWAMNRAAQHLQSGLSLASIADWLLSGNVSELADPAEFARVTAETFALGVAEGRAGVVGAAVRAEAERRFTKRLEAEYPGPGGETTRARLLQMYKLAEPHLLGIPQFRVGDVEERARKEAALLLDEALAEGSPEVMEQIERGGRRAGALLRRLLLAHGRVEYRLPGLRLALAGPITPAGVDLTATIDGDRITLRGTFSPDNVRALLAEAGAVGGADAASAVFRAFQSGENVFPPEQYDRIDAVLDPLAADIRGADQTLTEAHRDLRAGFEAGSRAVGAAAVAVGGIGGGTAGDVWDRASREETRPALSATGLRRARDVAPAYARALAAAPAVPPPADDPIAKVEAELLTLTGDVLAATDPVAAPERLAELAAVAAGLRDRLGKLDSADARVGQGRRALEAVSRALASADAEARAAVRDSREWLVVLHEEGSDRAALVPVAADGGALRHYYDGRQRILDHYVKLAGDPTRTFAARTRYVWLAQLVTHVHRRLPLSGRTDAGNLCGLVLELARHWHEGRSPTQVRHDFYAANPGGLPAFLPVQTVEHVGDLARGYRDHTDASRRTLHDLRTDLAGLEELVSALPAGAEVLLLNMTADDFAGLEWDHVPELFDAFRLQPGGAASLLPTALYVSRSAQRWPAAKAAANLAAFLAALDAKVHGEAHSGRCVVPPVLVAAPSTEPAAGPQATTAAQLEARRAEVAGVGALGAALAALQPNLAFPVFAVGAAARPAGGRSVVGSPYLLLARLCTAAAASPLAVEGTIKPPADARALAFVHPGAATVATLVDDWLAGQPDAAGVVRALGGELFGWWVSVVFRAEMGAGAIPVALRDRAGNLPAGVASPPPAVLAYWAHYTTPAAVLAANAVMVAVLAAYHTAYLHRVGPVGPRFDGWTLTPTAVGPAVWPALTGNPQAARGGTATPLAFLPRLLGKLF